MAKYHIERSIEIDAAQSEVKSVLIDFRQWPVWSPWLVMDRNTKLTYSDSQSAVNSSYEWSGDLTGEGGMKITSITDDLVEMDLNFVKPFKSKAQVKFDVEATGDNASKVTWHMFGSIPFPISLFMLKSVKSGVGMDFARGLRMLKEFLETGGVASVVELEESEWVEPSTYLGVAGHGNINENIGDRVQACFDDLMDFLVLNGVEATGPSFVIYDEFDLETGAMSYTCAVPVDADVKAPEESKVVRGEMPAGEAIKVRHTGSYQNLGNAWSTGMTFARYKKIKTKKVPTGIEVYRNDPTTVAIEDLDTEVLLLKR